jgi:hypothetical protein
MPKKLERELRQKAIQKRLTGEKKDRYIYGTLMKTGWRPKRDGNKHSQSSTVET